MNTDVVLLQTSCGRFEYLSAPIDDSGAETVRLAHVGQSRLIREYGNCTTPLNIVAISDGAKASRLRLVEIFGGGVQ